MNAIMVLTSIAVSLCVAVMLFVATSLDVFLIIVIAGAFGGVAGSVVGWGKR